MGQIIIITVVVEDAAGQHLRSKCQLAFHSWAFRVVFMQWCLCDWWGCVCVPSIHSDWCQDRQCCLCLHCPVSRRSPPGRPGWPGRGREWCSARMARRKINNTKHLKSRAQVNTAHNGHTPGLSFNTDTTGPWLNWSSHSAPTRPTKMIYITRHYHSSMRKIWGNKQYGPERRGDERR